MGQKISRLDEIVVNQIAAGEVVENPASIVKELIENSLDADAKRIRVAIQQGGLALIEVEDDGCGMNPEDAVLCLERYATSKIRSIHDLNSLATMGFRGEALAAIASVSCFSLKTSDGQIGTFVEVEGGRLQKVTPCARNQGTTICVSSLFFNVPARKKFQKSVASNSSQVRRVVEMVAASHPGCAFFLSFDGNVVLDLPIQERRERIETLFGSFAHEVEDSFVWGLLKEPKEAKSHRRDQFLYVNSRVVSSPIISKAVKMGYGTRLDETMHPSFVLFLKMDPKEVDVNVHPQKKEVRFADDSLVFQSIERSISKMFQPSLEIPSSLSFENVAPFRMMPDLQIPVKELEESVFLPFEFKERALAMVGSFLFLEKEELIVVDLKAAHARLLFETLKSPTKESQILLWPLEMDTMDDEDVDALRQLGIDCRLIGHRKMAIDALPPTIEAEEFSSFFMIWKETKKIENLSVKFCRQRKKRYSLEEGMDLWRGLQKCSDCLYDPIGNKIFKKVEEKDVGLWLQRG